MIITEGNPILSQMAKEIAFGEDCSELIVDMRKALGQTTGIGLAANQIGVLKRVILINTSDYVQTIINPVITASNNKFKNSTEGCLSFPNKSAKMKRESVVTVEGFDEDWKPIKKKCRGLLAVVMQHEIDHLNGITII